MTTGLIFYTKMDARGKIQIPKREYDARGWTTGIELHVRIVPKSPNQIYDTIKEEVLKRDGGLCQKCGTADKIRVHHLVPRVCGGTDELTNLATLCAGCHRKAHVATGQRGFAGKSRGKE
jgi:5-methylcytosine-specific restriction endonuclease McrA